MFNRVLTTETDGELTIAGLFLKGGQAADKTENLKVMKAKTENISVGELILSLKWSTLDK